MNRNKIEDDIKILSWYQIIGGLIGLGMIIYFILTNETFNNISIIFLFAALILYTFSIISGTILLKKHFKGIQLSKVNQFLQIISFAILGYAFHFNAGLSISVGLDFTQNLLLGFNTSISDFHYAWNSEKGEAFIKLNIVPIILIYLLDKIENELFHKLPTLDLTRDNNKRYN